MRHTVFVIMLMQKMHLPDLQFNVKYLQLGEVELFIFYEVRRRTSFGFLTFRKHVIQQ